MPELTEELIPFDQIEILADGTIQVREARVIMRDGVRDPNIPPRYNRYVLEPGADLAGISTRRITDIAQAVWTDEIVTAYTDKRAAELARLGVVPDPIEPPVNEAVPSADV